MSAPNILPPQKFTSYASAWANFIVGASAADVQRLFQDPKTKQAQLYVSFDLPGLIVPLLSTVGIAMVRMRFVLLPAADASKPTPTFGVVVYAADALGGRISAYYLGRSHFMDFTDQAKSCEAMRPHRPVATDNPTDTDPTDDSSKIGVMDGDPTGDGLVPFNLAKTWICNWCWAVQGSSLGPDMFATNYGPLQGFDFRIGDFLEPLFQLKDYQVCDVRAIFGLKTYYPAYPESAKPTSTFEVVIRPYSPPASSPKQLALPELLTRLRPLTDGGPGGGGDTGGSSSDQSQIYPPGGSPSGS